VSRRYYATVDDGVDWPPELSDYNKRFAQTLEVIKRRHDSVVTTMGMLTCVRSRRYEGHS
jgi:pyruvate dehydrogenase kinase 2/3/4